MVTSKKAITLNTHSIYTSVLNKLHKVFKISLNLKNKKGDVLGNYFIPKTGLWKDFYYSILPLRRKISIAK